jgi:hypothetical protein
MTRQTTFCLLALATAVLVSVVLGPAVSSQAQEQTGVAEAVSPRTRVAIAKALGFLKTQQHKDGSFGRSYQLANSALAGLAFLGNGNSYKRGPYGDQVAKVLQYILGTQDKWGYLDDNHCRMHGHGYATLFLAEIYGMLPREYQKRVQKALQKACTVIADSQTEEGGWGYLPSHALGRSRYLSDEGSVTVTVVQPLRAARNAGIRVPKAVIDKGIKYIQKCMGPQGCRYTISSRGGGTYDLTAGAVSVLNAAGIYKSKALDMGLKIMRKRIAGVDVPLRAARMFWYGNMYATQAMWHAGGKDWESFYPKSFEYLLQTQQENGSWGKSGYGAVFSTSIAVLMLEVPLGYLPMFER